MTRRPFTPDEPSDRADIDRLNALLDAMVSGKPAPESVPASDADALAAAARYVAMDAAAESVSDETLDAIWRNVMHAHGITADNVVPVGTPVSGTAARRPTPTRLLPRSRVPGRLNGLLSAAVVVLLLLGMAGAAWSLRGGGNGSDGGNGPHYLAAVQMPDGSTVEIEYRLPEPEDCTVEPLTVDEVMERLEGSPVPGSSPSKATAIADDATPQPPTGNTLNPVQPLSEETYKELAAIQREWLACSLYGSAFQVWALETDRMMREWFQYRYRPFYSMDLIRADLEYEYSATAENDGFARDVPPDSWLPMVPAYSEGYYNVQEGPGRARLTVFWMNQDGEVLLPFGENPQIDAWMNASQLERGLPNAWTFVYDEASGRWLLHEMKLVMG